MYQGAQHVSFQADRRLIQLWVLAYLFWTILGLIFPKCQYALCVIVLLAVITRDLVQHAVLSSIFISVLIHFLIQLLLSFNSFLHLLFPCLFSGTPRSIRRSWPTWTTWQESKSVAIKITTVFLFIYASWVSFPIVGISSMQE